MGSEDGRIPILYLAPWLDIGGSDKGTLDWLRFLDRDRFRPSLITTQPRLNRRLAEGARYADEVWDLPDLMPGNEFARFIMTFLNTRGVRLVHLMNSRIGFELLPDIAHLPDRPRVVVQLHVEEPDRTGYVRYVTTRYGNLVDAFSLSSHALSDALDAYEVPRAKRRVIYTGVDAEREFSPARVQAVDGLEAGPLHVLFPARLTAQKDPLMMVAAASSLRARGVDFRLHVLGDGELENEVRELIAGAGLADRVLLHGTRGDVERWYAACDVLLLTSEFEGLPYAVFEAMAMAKPVVAPALPGICELVTRDTGLLVTPRDDADAYAAALAELAGDADRRARMGTAARALVTAEHSLERMAAEHELLYEELLGQDRLLVQAGKRGSEAATVGRYTACPTPPNPGLRTRRPGASPLVSVIIPCYNHGRFLPDCLRSVAGQTYSQVETILVDNASTDPETLEALAQAEQSEAATLIRLHENRGPSAARNAAVERARGRYVLPLDADNMLLRGAIRMLVDQLSAAGERIGFVYPNYQFFGNRTEYFEPPSYNLYALLRANYCDSCSLIDRDVFDVGFRYPEDIVVGMEDWDFVLSLAEHGIYGEPARGRTMLYRKLGFSRVDLVETGDFSYDRFAPERHPQLDRTRAWLKGRWNPAVTVMAIDPIAAGGAAQWSDLEAMACRQTCADFELIVPSESEPPDAALEGRLRRIPGAPGSSRAQILARASEAARGRYLLGTYGSPSALLSDPTLIEKTLRVLTANPELDALALADAGAGTPPFRLLDEAPVSSARLGALVWPAAGPASPPAALTLPGARPLESLVRWLTIHGNVQWRHVRRRDRRAIERERPGPEARLGRRRHIRVRDARLQAETPAELPRLPPGLAERVQSMPVWMPPQSRLLCRQLHHASARYRFGADPHPAPGCTVDYWLGSLRGLPFPGTKSLVWDGHEFAVGKDVALDAPGLLGFVEQAPLPQFDAVWLARRRDSGQRILVAGTEDPLTAVVEDLVHVGFIEPYPIHPRRPPHAEVNYGLRGLVRGIDLHGRRHRYGVGQAPRGSLVGELGALLTEPLGECEGLWIDSDGWVSTARGPRRPGRPSLRRALRWTGAPLTWTDFSTPGPKVRATARRSRDSLRALTPALGSSPTTGDEPVGYLLRSPDSGTVPLYSGTHPVTGDQLLCAAAREASDLGYVDVVLLGHLIARAPATGRLGVDVTGIPWASRFGLLTASR